MKGRATEPASRRSWLYAGVMRRVGTPSVPLLLSILLAMVLVASACGGDDAASTTTTAAPTTSTVATTQATEAPTTEVTTTVVTTTTETPPSTLPPSKPFVTTIGLGGVIVGQTVEEAAETSGFTLKGKLDPDVSEVCYYVTPTKDSGLVGVSYMVYQDLIARVDIEPPSTTTTRSGAGIGLDADLLYELFPGQIEEAPQFTVDGDALMYIPQDEADADYRIIFNVADGRVTSYRSGILPAVGFGEGCL